MKNKFFKVFYDLFFVLGIGLAIALYLQDKKEFTTGVVLILSLWMATDCFRSLTNILSKDKEGGIGV